VPRGPLPEYRRRKEPVLDHVLQACLDQAGGKHDPQTGRYGILHWTGCETRDRVTEIVRALYRSARHMNLSLPYPDVVKQPDNTFTIVVQPAHKSFGRKHQIATKGTDRSQWAYDPKKPNGEK
jgi:hypothetical protein